MTSETGNWTSCKCRIFSDKLVFLSTKTEYSFLSVSARRCKSGVSPILRISQSLTLMTELTSK